MKRLLKRSLLSLAIFLASALSVGWAQEEKTPSQKTKEAVEKFNKAPGKFRRGLKSLEELGKEKLEALKAKESAEGQGNRFALPEKKPGQSEETRYSGIGKRDPFRPFTLRTSVTRRRKRDLSPLERYELGQLRLVGIVWSIKEPRAMVEDSTGLGYIVKVGTPIGANEGKVKEITPTEVVIQESVIDFYGARKDREVSMKLPKEQP